MVSIEAGQVYEAREPSSPAFRNKVKLVLSGISGAFMLPISTLAITTLFLSLGGFVESIFKNQGIQNQGIQNQGIQKLGGLVKSLSFPILQALPLLFCVAFTVAFCGNDPLYIWGAIISYLSFLAVQDNFIYSANNNNNEWIILFPSWGRNSKFLVGKTLGITSLNTSVFGSLVIGAVLMPYLKRDWSDVNLPTYLSFFSGKRFLPLAASVGGTYFGLQFLVFWPWIGNGISIAGQWMAKAPGGVDSFLFGFLERSLLPFGLHHTFYAPFWYSSLGGDVANSLANSSANSLDNSSGNLTADIILSRLKKGELASTMWAGDSFIGASVIALPSDTVTGTGTGTGTKVFEYLKQQGVNVGRFTSGKYPVMQIGLPCAGIAMLLEAREDRRKEASAVLVPAILNCFLMGITEPLEFTFLFCAPKLFYYCHAVLCGAAFALMNVLGSHIPSVFSGGFIEFVLMGIIPMAKGTKPENVLFVGFMLAPFYYWIFLLSISKYNIPTPGREPVEPVLAVEGKQEIEEPKSKVPEPVRTIAIALGGWDNIGKMINCATRLRYDIIDRSKVNEVTLKSSGVLAVKWVGDNHVQMIMGPKAQFLNQDMLKWKGEDLGV